MSITVAKATGQPAGNPLKAPGSRPLPDVEVRSAMNETADDRARVARIQRTFDLAADGYDGPALGFFESISREVVAILAVDPASRVLDVPCGTGHATRAVLEILDPDGTVVGIDISEPMLERARSRIGSDPRVQLRLGDLRSLDETPAGFDLVLCVFGIFFVPEMAKALHGLWQLVSPAGRLVLVTWAPNDMAPLKPMFMQRVHELRPDLVPVHPAAHPSPTSTRNGLIALFQEAGINVPIEFVDIDHNQSILTPEAWWEMVMGSGFRIHVDAMTQREAADVRAVCDAAVLRDSITTVSCDALMAVVTRPTTG